MVRLSMTVAALVAGLTLSASTLGANEAGTIVVAVDGTGDHDSITDALAVATEGDTISVRPGMYEEFLSIDGAISVVGDGDPEAIILSWNVADPPVVRMSDARGELSGLTIRAPGSYVHLAGGEPVLRDLRFDAVGSAMDLDACHALIGPESCNAVAVRIEGGDPAIEVSAFEGPGGIFVSGGATALIEGNVLVGGGHVFLEDIGAGTVIRGNAIEGPVPFGVALYGAGTPVIEGNVIEAAGTSGIDVGLHRQPGIEPVIRDNVVTDSPTGIQLHQDADAVLEDNGLQGNGTGVVITGSAARLIGNVLEGNATGVFIMQGAPMLEDNVIGGGTVGVGLGSDRAVPLLSGNAICDNETDINLLFGAEMPDVSADASCH